jgi:hypothetical protein
VAVATAQVRWPIRHDAIEQLECGHAAGEMVHRPTAPVDPWTIWLAGDIGADAFEVAFNVVRAA